MLYIAAPTLSVSAPGAQGVFSVAWLLFALFVIAGNLTGILYQPKRPGRVRSSSQSGKLEKKSRSF